MVLLASLCCSSSDRPSKLEAESRHARLVRITSDPRGVSTRHLPQRWDYPYQDSPPAYNDVAQQPLLSIDEKQPINFQLTVETEDDAPPPLSPRSSVISIPSTRLTDLTAAQTGETLRTSRRESLERVSTRGSLPPYSYCSRRSASPASTIGATSEGERDIVWTHPVMSSNWLEVLRQDTITQNSQQRGQRTMHVDVTRGARDG